MRIAETTRPHLLTREAAAARIEELEATLDVVTAQLNHNTDLMGEATARIAVLQKSLRDVTRLWYKQKETIGLLETALRKQGIAIPLKLKN